MLVRTVTALVLIAVIFPVLFFGSGMAVNMLALVIFAVACWEACRLFWSRYALPITIVWVGIYLGLFYSHLLYRLPYSPLDYFSGEIIWAIGLIWLALFVPALKYGLPKRDGWLNTVFGVGYLAVIAASLLSIRYLLWLGMPSSSEPFVDIEDLLSKSRAAGATFLLSAMSIVWAADIGAYFAGKTFGRHRLAPSISPGKTWEGVLGGWICVLIVGAVSTQISLPYITFFSLLQAEAGWIGLMVALSFLTMVSVTGDLIESQLKRRAQVKDSSRLLPGHGGILDRIDALIFVLPMTLLVLNVVSRLVGLLIL